MSNVKTYQVLQIMLASLERSW